MELKDVQLSPGSLENYASAESGWSLLDFYETTYRPKDDEWDRDAWSMRLIMVSERFRPGLAGRLDMRLTRVAHFGALGREEITRTRLDIPGWRHVEAVVYGTERPDAPPLHRAVVLFEHPERRSRIMYALVGPAFVPRGPDDTSLEFLAGILEEVIRPEPIRPGSIQESLLVDLDTAGLTTESGL